MVETKNHNLAVKFGCCCVACLALVFGELASEFTAKQPTLCRPEAKLEWQNLKQYPCSASPLQVTLKPVERSFHEPIELSAHSLRLLAFLTTSPAKTLLPICQGGGFRFHISAIARKMGSQPYMGS
ncbi:hypothetical protein GG496_000362 [Candidatus Fervidibacteria bacterium JGI MDM2 JNZ-1-D12]